jgi:hypothetical protein
MDYLQGERAITHHAGLVRVGYNTIRELYQLTIGIATLLANIYIGLINTNRKTQPRASGIWYRAYKYRWLIVPHQRNLFRDFVNELVIQPETVKRFIWIRL